jgi:hypothetical protein
MSLDELLSSSIKSAAEPAASKGVADAIRARVAAGDTGTAVAGSTAPGWGGGASGILTIVAPIALIVVVGVTGGALGASGLMGGSSAPAGGDIPAYVLSDETAPIYSCPGGPEVGSIPASTRVLAVARDADSTYLGVRDPANLTSTVWFETGALVLDPDTPEISSLPVEECPEVTVTEVEPTPTPEPTESTPPDDGNNNPPPPSDTTPPSVKPGNFNPNGVYGTGSAPYCNEYSDIVVAIADNVGIASVSASQSHPGSSITQIGQNGQNYTFRFVAGLYSYPMPDLNVTVTFTAKDAAGNTASNTKNITIYNTCLI